MGSAEVSVSIALGASFPPCLFPHYSFPYRYVSQDHSSINFCTKLSISESVSVESITRQHQVIFCTKIIWIVALNIVQLPRQSHWPLCFPLLLTMRSSTVWSEKHVIQPCLLCFVLSGSVLYPRTLLMHQEQDLFHIKMKHAEEFILFKGTALSAQTSLPVYDNLMVRKHYGLTFSTWLTWFKTTCWQKCWKYYLKSQNPY